MFIYRKVLPRWQHKNNINDTVYTYCVHVMRITLMADMLENTTLYNILLCTFGCCFFLWIQVYFKCWFRMYVLSLTHNVAAVASGGFFFLRCLPPIHKYTLTHSNQYYLRLDCSLRLCDNDNGRIISVEISISDYCHEHVSLNLFLLHFVHCVQLIGRPFRVTHTLI